MAKDKTVYVCADCGADSNKWQGQCAACGAWNTLSEYKIPSLSNPSSGRSSGYAGSDTRIQTLADISLDAMPRIPSGFQELDRVLGGGVVPGSAILIGGSPGAGKSTLLLQVMCYWSDTLPVLYITGEESLQQVAMRAERLGLSDKKLQLFSETRVEAIISMVQKHQPKAVVVDSIQVMSVDGVTSAPGSVSQVRESAAFLTRLAKQTGTIIWLVGHVTKDGTLAGPKVLEHMIDCSVMMEGSDDSRFRTLRSHKNRFGAVNELGVFAMTGQGLKEVSNPSAIFLSRIPEPMSGSVVMVIWEGTRPLLVEIQALVDDSNGQPRRLAVGLDSNRLAMLLAILHRHGGLEMGQQDVFVNVVGGVKVTEPGSDLALLLAVVSSFRNKPLPQDLVVFGEVGLSGEIRPVPSGQERLQEAVKHGFKRAIVPKANTTKSGIAGMKILAVQKLGEVIDALMELE
ncbi:MAG TPA: DNA repair protein RadA [Flavobacteriales bacterium]|nr:DNA repair protein RadA [Flavobacteriales bacterium]